MAIALLTAALIGLLCPGVLLSQAAYFAGAFGGISTLSGDGRSIISDDLAKVSLSKPENGPAFMLFGGRHFNDYLSFQASYGFNRNDLTLTSTLNEGEDFEFYEQERSADNHSLFGEVLLYFRKRDSFARPYLTVGMGLVRLASGAGSIRMTRGTLPAPGSVSSNVLGLRVAVGIDLFLKKNWAFRYSFSETISDNPISEKLSPPGTRGLKNFQNLFGFVRYF